MHEILAIRKETEQKFRWDALVGDAPFELYIPKWRVPDIVPSRIKVKVMRDDEIQVTGSTLTQEEVRADPDLKKRDIYSRVEYDREHTKTVRYKPIGDEQNWEIGSPYVPKAILADEFPSILQIVVEWV